MFNDYEEHEIIKHKKKRINKSKKSDHKHDYELVDIEDRIFTWFTKIEVCRICGREGNSFR